jgi:hypothetical protein
LDDNVLKSWPKAATSPFHFARHLDQFAKRPVDPGELRPSGHDRARPRRQSGAFVLEPAEKVMLILKAAEIALGSGESLQCLTHLCLSVGQSGRESLILVDQ